MTTANAIGKGTGQACRLATHRNQDANANGTSRSFSNKIAFMVRSILALRTLREY
jgi:hypothetical protein